MLLHTHLKNISIVCLELLDLAFFDADCEVVSPDLKKEKNSKIFKYTMQAYTIFTTLDFRTLLF